MISGTLTVLWQSRQGRENAVAAEGHHLVLGVVRDGVDQDENVAIGGAVGFEPPCAIKVDTVTDGGVAYTT